ncbi:unnamed protein product [Cyprideis torosa]|uniref:Uncharacterized protein n=1 Tax=Cyprideis torosa TaxID=163714 RepID=A0A7R8W8V3_9CRUS|nr:unnamed protein product [Cyprideis torosa]CAG0886634.1 unnamed protein product [Cyprideis torosa]
MAKLSTVVVLFYVIGSAYAMIDGLYCGLENCYDVLGVTRDHSRKEIAKAYRQLARKHHPDRQSAPEAKLAAEETFRRIANAYEILNDDDTRKDYDYLLDNPEEFYSHYYRYYSRRMAPKVDVRIVILVTLSVISAVQYYAAWCRYDTAIRHLATVPRYRLQAVEMAREEGLLGEDGKARKKERRSGKTKEEQKREEEEVIRKIIAEKMDIRGAYAKPSIYDTLWLQLVLLPYTVVMFCVFHIRWVWKFMIKREPYGEAEKLYLIRKYLGENQAKFDARDEAEHEKMLKLELWQKDKFQEWKQEKDEEEKRKMAENSRYKAYRRYVKNHGVPRMTFEED